MSQPALQLEGVGKRFGRVTALGSVDLRVDSGSYFVLLGPSGGGKTTLLRTIGGFVRPTSGRVRIRGEDVTDLPPEKRPTSMVFQSYALFPHMDVARNVGYGLRLRKLPREQVEAKVEAALRQVSLDGYGERRVWALSGGQQQRVQLARALVLEPAILLLDEPLAALDAQLRKDMCYELKHLQAEVGITFVHVTHNQEEAMTVADHIAVIADGELVEEGSPRQIYDAPKRRFTAGFVGENNVLSGKVESVDDDMVEVQTPVGIVRASARGASPRRGDKASVSIRSERVHIARGADGSGLPATYRECVYLGLTTQHVVTLADGRDVTARVLSGNDGGKDGDAVPAPGEAVRATWSDEDARLLLY